MLGIFKKKQNKAKLSQPPLPDLLPPMPADNNSMDNGVKSIHDQIPNDIPVSQSIGDIPEMMQPTQKTANDFSPETLPSLDEEEPAVPNDSNNFQQMIPKNVETKELPPLPEVPDAPNEEPDHAKMHEEIIKPLVKMPAPENEEVPSPPEIFSGKGFYEIPEEVRYLANERKEADESNHEDYTPELNNERKQGPVFVDITAFRMMLQEIDVIKSKVKVSEDILKHMYDIKTSKDGELERFRTTIEDMEKKLSYIDKIAFKEEA